jgi:hypothetical protein
MGLAPPDETPEPKPTSKKPAPASSSDPYANYTTAASLGITDEDAAKAVAEAEARQKEGTIGQWERVIKPKAYVPPPVPTGGFAPTRGVKKEEEDVKPDSNAQAGVSASLGLGQEEEEHPVEAAKKRGFLTEKSALPFDDDDDDPLASLGPIKLKKRRLTVKEQQAIEDEAAAKVRERAAAEGEAQRRGANTGWAAANVAEDEEFDPLAGLGLPAEGEGAAGAEEAKPAVEEEKPKVASGGFKKRKMHGAGAVRKK